MVTHNMKDAIRYGNRLVMMHEGNIIYDVSGEEKANLQVSDLLAKFEAVSNGESLTTACCWRDNFFKEGASVCRL